MGEPPTTPAARRRARLAEELRRNLKRRKVQQRARTAAEIEAGAEPGEGMPPAAGEQTAPEPDGKA